MRHHTAAQLGEGGGWHYVSLGRDGGYPLGNCLHHPPHPDEHDARKCYQDWRRDNVLLDGNVAWTSCSVKDCLHPANKAARINGDGFALAPLCDCHLTWDRAYEALGLTEPWAGDSWHS